MMDGKQLMALAAEARKMSYSPYSHYAVGAAILTKEGKVFTGCNVESASYSPTICAERTATVKAVSEGYRSFVAVAIVGGKQGETTPFCAPCGVCRQLLSEFCDQDTVFYLGTPDDFKAYPFGEVMPYTFTSKDLL